MPGTLPQLPQLRLAPVGQVAIALMLRCAGNAVAATSDSTPDTRVEQ